LITINAPLGLGIRDNPADITVRGDGNGTRRLDSEVIDTQDALRVGSDATFGLVGGNLIFEDATIKTAGGRIELGSVAGGQVNLEPVENGLTLDYSGINSFRDITLSGSSNIDASGLGGGDIQVAGRNISFSDISAIESNTLGSVPGGDINIFASESLTISGIENEDNFVSAITTLIFPQGTADGGDINIETGSLSLGDRALIRTSVSGQGNAGNITINATETVSLDGAGTGFITDVNTDAIGNAGDINITTSSLNLSNGAFLNTSTSGQGNLNAGNIIVNASGAVSVSNNSTIFVPGVTGGSLDINAKSLEVTSGSFILAGISTDSGSVDSQAGDIIINLTEDLVVDGAGSDRPTTTISNQNFGTGNAGNVVINARNINFNNDGRIANSNNGQGSIGDTIINATENITFDGFQGSVRSGISNFVGQEGIGNVGIIEITAQNLNITNGALVQSLVSGNASSGDINIDVANTIFVDGFVESLPLSSGISSILSRSGNGNSGDININTQNLFLSRNGEINASVLGLGNAGDININANKITIGQQGKSTIPPSGIRSQVFNNSDFLTPDNDNINSGNIDINTNSLSISDGGEVNAGIINSFGNGGNIIINATESISVDGTGIVNINNNDIEIASEISSDILGGSLGNSGNIEINTPNLSVSNNAFISSDIFGTGNSGNIEINTTGFSLTDGAFVSASIFPEGQGTAGSITINATDSVKLSGGVDIRTDIADNAIGSGGDLFLQAENLTLSGGSQIGASTSGEGNAGSVEILVNDTIELIGQSELGRSGLFANATVGSGNGGDLNIFTDNLILRDGATIRASNFQSLGLLQPGSGNSGDVTINAETIVAFPNQNNDIVANALQGNGGNINITADAILGIAERPNNPNTNDIDASSQTTGLDGTVNINIPDINSLQSVDRLRASTISATIIGTDACSAAEGKSNFIMKGKGGIPPGPKAPLSDESIIPDSQAIALEKETAPTVLPREKVQRKPEDPNYIPANIKPVKTDHGDIYPARGIMISEDGTIVLTAYPTNHKNNRVPQNAANCDA